ncbi:MAG TPA: alpha/beta hydrolase [Thermoanaerobaculia bacterium]|nr:alpha/beta hydrolase [Thermoanaerobaculia bacterium]
MLSVSPRSPSYLLLLWSLLLACRMSAVTADRPTSSTVLHDGVRLHYLEWRRPGPTLVFIPGLGDTAYVMSDFARRFSSQYHVIILTRRGFGRSGVPKEGYDLSTRTEDIRVMLDALAVKRAVLIGHSIAGDELTAFATRYPHRVAGLVYLDAAYDRADPEAPKPTASVWSSITKACFGGDSDGAQRSLEAYRRSMKCLFFGIWSKGQEENLRETTVVNIDGTVSARTPSWVPREISEAAQHEKVSLSSVHAPALLLFARQRMEKRGLVLDETTRQGLVRDEDAYEAYFARYQKKLRAQKNLQIVVLQQTLHHLYLEKPAEVEILIRRFLDDIRTAGQVAS